MSPPTGYVRGRSNSLRVDDILMRRSNSLRFGLEASRKINSFEELGISPLTPLTRDQRTGSIKIPTNGSIGLEVGCIKYLVLTLCYYILLFLSLVIAAIFTFLYFLLSFVIKYSCVVVLFFFFFFFFFFLWPSDYVNRKKTAYASS